MLCTTLNKIRNHSPCEDGWSKLLKYLNKTKADDEDLPLLTVLESNGLDDTLWCLRTLPEYNKEWLLFAIWCARKVQHLMTDQRSIDALDVAERFVNGEATQDELTAAGDTAEAAWDAARDAAMAAGAAWATAWDAARAAAMAAGAAAWATAWDAARDEQEQELRRIIS